MIADSKIKITLCSRKKSGGYEFGRDEIWGSRIFFKSIIRIYKCSLAAQIWSLCTTCVFKACMLYERRRDRREREREEGREERAPERAGECRRLSKTIITHSTQGTQDLIGESITETPF